MKRVVLSLLSVAFGALCVTLAAAGAAEVSGTVKKINAAKNTVVITVDGTDKTFQVNTDASFISVSTTKNKKGKAMETVRTIDSLSGIQVGAKVTLLTETVGAKEVVRAMKVEGGETKAKAKGKGKKKKANK